MKRFFLIATCLVCMAFCGSCDDEDEYVSVLPAYSDITFDTDQLYTGMKVTATAVQATKGKLLDATKYDWYINDTTSTSVRVVYDDANENPKFIFTVPAVATTRPGNITVKFTGNYRVSGTGCKVANCEHAPGLVAVYSPSPTTGTITLSKTVTVYPSTH